jgi:hypothetical protein
MGQTYYSYVSGARIASADRQTDHSGADDTNVTGWTIGTDFVLCVHLSDNGKNTVASTHKLQWNKNGGSFTDLASTGELNYTVGGATDLTDGTACTATSDFFCTLRNPIRVDGTEREDSNATVASDLPGSPGTETEHQWAIATDSATASSVYDFQLVDTANGNRIDAISVTLTMSAATPVSLTINDVESTTEIDEPTYTRIRGIVINDVESTTEVATVTPVRIRQPSINDVESVTEIGTPTVTLAAVATNITINNVESATEIGEPAYTRIRVLSLNDVESATEVGTPSCLRIYTLSINDVESATEIGEPAYTRHRGLTVNDVESATEISEPSYTRIRVLAISDVESTTEINTLTPVRIRVLSVDDTESATEIGTVTVALPSNVAINANNVESTTEIGNITPVRIRTLSIDDAESVTEINTAAVNRTIALSLGDIESATEVGEPAYTRIRVLSVGDVESATEIDTSTMGRVRGLTIDDVSSATEIEDIKLYGQLPATATTEILVDLDTGNLYLKKGKVLIKL